MGEPSTDIAPWLERWGLQPDGWPFQTIWTRSLLQPVRRSGQPCMLKLATYHEEVKGAAVMAWWAGEGAAPVLAHEANALLMVRAEGERDLAAWVAEGRDDAATEVLCAALADLHRPRGRPAPEGLIRLEDWFRSVERQQAQGDVFVRGHQLAQALLAEPQDVRLLHGDMHHGNVLDFGAAGWLAIDPKGVTGERAYDYANIFRNPDMATPLSPGRLERQLELVCRLAALEPRRMLQWVCAHAVLSLAWCLEDNLYPDRSIDFIRLAFARLDALGGSDRLPRPA
ncbi:aminoglycoside phosphotransferase family protein [Phenylobacterium sp.]|jgi:streptomycin 6-kinase|uniref:aminoglycoside phosphotransferase family protein n=1 Tax=Phenylobacterium sp. TaxID=1871053 RepID=UPI002F942576